MGTGQLARGSLEATGLAWAHPRSPQASITAGFQQRLTAAADGSHHDPGRLQYSQPLDGLGRSGCGVGKRATSLGPSSS